MFGRLEEDRLLIADRGFYNWPNWQAATGAALLWQVKADLRQNRHDQLKTCLRGPGQVLRSKARTWSARKSTATCSPTTPSRHCLHDVPVPLSRERFDRRPAGRAEHEFIGQEIRRWARSQSVANPSGICYSRARVKQENRLHTPSSNH
jgi:hypothetical protein